MRKDDFVSIYSQQTTICWDMHQTLAEAQEFLESGAEIEAIYPIAIYDRVHQEIVWKEESLEEEAITSSFSAIIEEIPEQ